MSWDELAYLLHSTTTVKAKIHIVEDTIPEEYFMVRSLGLHTVAADAFAAVVGGLPGSSRKFFGSSREHLAMAGADTVSFSFGGSIVGSKDDDELLLLL